MGGVEKIVRRRPINALEREFAIDFADASLPAVELLRQHQAKILLEAN
jgi:hypothetical protein